MSKLPTNWVMEKYAKVCGLKLVDYLKVIQINVRAFITA